MARFIVELMDGGKLSYETGMSELQKGKAISEDIDIAEEAKRLGLVSGPPMLIVAENPDQELNP
jgi:hypothetical protein